MSRQIYENFKSNFPNIADEAVDYRDVTAYEIEVLLSDGSAIMYDELHKTIRRLPRDCNNMTEDECRREFGMRLRSIMFLRNIDQAQLSRMTGIPQPSISNYINGKTSPSFHNADRIAKALKCSADVLRYTR
jgi:predicted XRE-type DNA-binding protein